MRMLVLALIPLACMQMISLTILYEKTGLQDAKDVYRYVVETVLDRFNHHLQRRGIQIGLLDLLAYDDYLGKAEYRDATIAGGEELLETRLEALKDIPTNVILVASASQEEEDPIYVFNSPCMSRYIANMITRDVVDDDLLSKIVYSLFEWMGRLFKTAVPNPIKERSPEVFDKFAKDAATPEFMDSLSKCSRESRSVFEKFVRKSEWDDRALNLRNSLRSPNIDREQGVDISSSIKWVLPAGEERKSAGGRSTGKRSDEESSSGDASRGQDRPNRKSAPEEEPARGREEEKGPDRKNTDDGTRQSASEPVAAIEDKIRQELQRIIAQERISERARNEAPAYPAPGEKRADNISLRATTNQITIPLKDRRGSLSYGRIPYRRSQGR